MLDTQQRHVQDAPQVVFKLAPQGRIHRLREGYWATTYQEAMARVEIAGCGEDTLVGHARDFGALLAASEPFIQPDELIVGTCHALPLDREAIDLAQKALGYEFLSDADKARAYHVIGLGYTYIHQETEELGVVAGGLPSTIGAAFCCPPLPSPPLRAAQVPKPAPSIRLPRPHSYGGGL